ncbi:MAG: ATP-binding protein, partial [Spirochaetales bacterium]|nr:ATP-binding protein [Spirochaetales bacterium]
MISEKTDEINPSEIADLIIPAICTNPEAKTKCRINRNITSRVFPGSKTEIISLIYNLMKNARDAVMANGRDEKTIDLDIHIAGRDLKIEVRDNGRGMDLCEDNNCRKESCLECPYQEFGKSEKSEGSGLGLWSVRQYLRKAAGDIKFESERGKYTKVTVSVPGLHGKH